MAKRRSRKGSSAKPPAEKTNTPTTPEFPPDAWLSPLRVMICGKDNFRQQQEFVTAIRRAFNGVC
ncbi:MAG TPA: hypothetical protein EYG03_27295 [Planctomycetes bacterium]|nr:hypothetical protein [Fuerstiella sp.]HIK95670.1 hypothetical protein [Planctomycetota bacterium]